VSVVVPKAFCARLDTTPAAATVARIAGIGMC
jgi:hypothetical protein